MNHRKKAFLQLHFAVVLFSFTAILGDLIHLPALVLVWWRVLITLLSLFVLIHFGKELYRIPTRTMLKFAGVGLLVALHWICFFGAIKYANASICLVCLATTSFMTAILEPVLLRQKIRGHELLLGLLVVPGMFLVVNNTELQMMTGIWIGLASALFAALFTILNKLLIHEADPLSISFLELSSGGLMLSLALAIYFHCFPEANFWPQWRDLIYLLILSLVCTTLAYVLALKALKYISAFASNLAYNLEPVYGMLLAVIILKENQELNTGFYLGAAVVVVAVISHPFLKNIGRK